MNKNIVLILLVVSAAFWFSVPAMGQGLVLTRVADTLNFNEGDTISLHIIASYPSDSSLIRLSTHPFVPNFGLHIDAIFVDSSLTNVFPPVSPPPVDTAFGRGSFDWLLSLTSSGVYGITFIASVDSGTTHLVDSQHVIFSIHHVPHVYPVRDTSVIEGQSLTFKVFASRPNAGFDSLYAGPLPPNASFPPTRSDSGIFVFNPNYAQSGIYPISFYSTDGQKTDSQKMTITVIEFGNHKPLIAPIDSLHLREGSPFSTTVMASDSDGTIPALSMITSVPVNATFVDSLNGHGQFTITPSATPDTFSIKFIASDGQLADTIVVPVTVLANNLPPILDNIPNRTVNENQADTFYLHAVSQYLDTIRFAIIPLPRNLDTLRLSKDSMRCIFAPDFFQSGVDSVEFYAYNSVSVDSQQVTITVINVNRPPVLHATVADSISIDEKQTLSFLIIVTDPDSTIDVITTRADTLPNASFVYHHNDTASFTFTPGSRQAGSYDISFYGSDGMPKDSSDTLIIHINVVDLAPALSVKGSTSVREGRYVVDTLVAINNRGSSATIGFSPPPSDTSYHGRVYFRQTGPETAIFMYFPDYYKVGPDTVEADSLPVTFSASSGVDTNFVDHVYSVGNVHKDPNDTLNADTLTVTSGGGEWDGVGPLVLHANIVNDFGVTGALTGFRWFDTSLQCDSVILNPALFNPLDTSLYRAVRIYNDSLRFDCEFLFFDSKSLAKPGGNYFNAYFSYRGTWGPLSMLFFDSTKIGSTGDFIFDRRVRAISRKAASRDEFALSPENSFTYRPLLLVDPVFSVLPVDVTGPGTPVIPDKFSLEQNYPNPFNPSTTIKFSLARQSNVKLAVYNILGQEVAVLTERGYPPGEYKITWDGRDRNGTSAASGIYLYRIVADGISQTRKMILLK